jgi:hypothetical protein
MVIKDVVNMFRDSWEERDSGAPVRVGHHPPFG